MENFDLKGWMKANNQGPYKMFESFEGKKNKKKLNEGIGGYVDMKPVNEADSMIFGKDWQYRDNDWMEDVDGTEAYKVGEWTCYYDHPGTLVWTYGDKTLDELAVYATPGYDEEGVTTIQVDKNGETVDTKTIDQGFFDSFDEYAEAVLPHLKDIQRGEALDELEKPEKIYADEDDENSYLNRDTRMMALGGEQIKTGIEDLLDKGYEQDEVLDFLDGLIDGFYDEDDFGDFQKGQMLVKQGVDSLIDDGFDPDDIKEFCNSVVRQWETSSGGAMNELEKPENIYADEDNSLPYDRIMDLGGEQIEQGIISLMDGGFEPEDILELVNELLKNRTNMEKNYGKF